MPDSEPTKKEIIKAEEKLADMPATPWWTSVTSWINLLDSTLSVLALLTIIITTIQGHEIIQQHPELAKWLIVAGSGVSLAVSVITLIRRWAGNLPLKPILGMLLMFVLLGGSAMADDVTLRITGLTRGQSYELSVGNDGSVAVKPIPTVVVGNPPTPTPTPNPTPNLTTRGIAIRDAALKATGDTERDTTAAKLALLYQEIAKKARTNDLNGRDDMEFVLKRGADMVMPNAAAEKAWQNTRDVLTLQWTAVAQVPGMTDEDYAKLLDEAAAGLNASIKQFQAIDFKKLLELILQILDIIMKLLPQHQVPLR